MIGRLLLALVLLGISAVAIAVGGWMAGWIRYPVVETALTHRLNNLVPGYQFSFDQAHLDLSALEWRKLDSTIFDEPLGLSVDRVKIIDEQGGEIADIDNLRALIEVDFIPGLVFRIIGLELGAVTAILPSDKIQELDRIFTSPLPGGSLEAFLSPATSQEAAKSDISYQQAHQFIRELVESSLVAFTQNLAFLPDGLTSLQQLVVKQATIHRIEDEKILPVAQDFSFELVSGRSDSIDVKSRAQVMVPELSDQPVPLSFSLMIKDQPQEKTRAGTLSLLIESSPIVHNLYQLGQSLPGLNPSLESWREKLLSPDFMQANTDQDLSLTARFTSDHSTKAYEIQDIDLRLDSRGSENNPGPLMSVGLKSQSSEEFEGHLVFSHMALAGFSDQIQTELPMFPLDESSLHGQMKGRLSYYSKAPDLGGTREQLNITLEALGDDPLVIEHPDYKLTFFNPAINFDLPLAPGETMNQAFDFTSENIRIDSPAHFSKPLDLYGFNAKARFEETGLSLQAFDVSIDPSSREAARLKGQANFTRSDEETSIQLSARVTNYPVPMLASHWPKTLNPPTRSWVTRNVTAGHVSDAQVELSGTYADGKFTPDTLEGSITLVDGTVDYLSSMPAAQVETAQINFDSSAFTIAIQQAEIDTDIQVQNGRVEISELDQERPRIDITLPFNGSLTRTLDVLKGPANQFSDQLSLTDATISGEINGFIGGVFKTGFELSQDVQADEVTVQATGQITDLSWQRQALQLESGMTLPAGKLTSNILDFNMTRDAYDIKGNVEFLFDETGLSPQAQDSIQADIVWQQTSSDDDQPARDLQLVLSTSAKQLDHFGLPVTNIAQGPIDLTLSYQEWQQRTQIISTIDLTDSELTLEGVSWSKDRAVPARLYMRIEPDLSSRRFMVEDFSYHDDQATRIEGTLSIAQEDATGDYQIQSALLGPMQFKGADLDRVTYKTMEDRHLVEIKGKALDLEQILPGDDLSEAGQEDDNASSNLPQNPVEFALNLDQLTLESGTNLSGVEASLTHKTHQGTGYIERLALTSSRGRDQLLSVTLSPLDQANALPGAAIFSAKGPTASLLLESIGLGGQIEGGAFQIDGTRERSGQPFQGAVMIEEFTLRDAPVMSKLLQVASLTGILSALTESGLSFIEMRADYSYDQGRLALENLIAPGISVGLTARGWLDLPDKNLELQGLIVPAYFANQILNLIPVLGTLLTGGDGGGLLAASYQANGNLYDPDISANPATLLAPGIIREIFRGATLPDQ